MSTSFVSDVSCERHEVRAHNDDQDKKDVSHGRHHLELRRSPSSRRASGGKRQQSSTDAVENLKKEEKRWVLAPLALLKDLKRGI